MIKSVKNLIYLLFAAIILAYIIICDVLMSFSIVMNFCFIVAAIFMILIYYMKIHPIDYKEREPSFRYIFIKTAFIFYYGFIILLIIFNIFYPKTFIPESQKYDYIIVFGAGISENKTEIINSRIDNAIVYAKKYNRCKFVLTGAKGSDEPIEEAFYMKNYMLERGIEEDRILVDPFSVNTNENIVNSLELIKLDIFKRNPKEHIITRPFQRDAENFDLDFLDIGFMSSDFHLTRIAMMAKKKGIRKPIVIKCDTNLLYIPYQYVREDLSLFKAFILNQLKL